MLDEQATQLAPTQVEPEVSSETPQEFDIEKADNVTQIREYAKGLKTDLDTYKTTHKFVEDSFGDIENAKLAQDVYSKFTSAEFNPDEFVKAIEGLSPTRAKALVEKLAEQQSGTLVQKRLGEMFGGEVNQDEIKLFKQLS